jgi:hypothetical protein
MRRNSTSVTRYSDAPRRCANAGWVQIVRFEPYRPYEKLGEIVVKPR